MNFEYAISYSGLREQEFELLEKLNQAQIKKIEKEIRSARFVEKSKLKIKAEALKNEIDIVNSRVIDKNGTFHKSTKLIRRFKIDDLELKKLLGILQTKFKEQYIWMCAPIYRNALVFYSKKGEISGILQICFSCESIKNENEEDFEVDLNIFPILKNELIKIGHNIEE